ncbi:hypothetical protein [Dactylosporangium sp. NPDC050588]|uniref:hypothetical protein n=1 Tax=Dactylosporangium sp. NPDC050588 TaxID=3157211 RepID=UPI0033CEC31B
MSRRVKAPSTARLRGILANAARVRIVDARPDEVDHADAARIVVTGGDIAGLARVLSVVDGGVRDSEHCWCGDRPTMVVTGADGRDLARWTVHGQTQLSGLGDRAAELRDAPALIAWLAEHGLTGPRDAQLRAAREAADAEARRVRWVAAAPLGLQYFAEAVTLREHHAEERLAGMLARRIPDLTDRIRALVTWAGVPAREDFGTFWHELVPQRFLLAEPTGAIFDALAAAPLSAGQLDGAAELFTCLEWTRPLRAGIPAPLRAQLIAHVTATGTEPMLFRMRHGYGAAPEEPATSADGREGVAAAHGGEVLRRDGAAGRAPVAPDLGGAEGP